jgi:DNA-directed RNA polymerase subunit RPC12/RpoP
MATEENKELTLLVDQLIQEADDLLHTIIENTKTTDDRSKVQQSRWTERHRLNVLLEVARETRKKLPTNTIVAPWFLAELKATLEVIRRWHGHPSWNEIEPSLVNPTHFTHTITKLWIAEQLKSAGHVVQIIPRGEKASPDLMAQAIGGTQDWINVECYQPSILNGGTKVSIGDLEKIVKRSMKKAKRQLDNRTPGILAICGFNQPRAVMDNLKRISANRLGKTERSNLCGFSFVMLGILYRRNAQGTQFTPTISLDFVPNPSYFGRVEIVSEISTSDPNLIKEPLTDVSTEDMVENKIQRITAINDSPSTELHTEIKIAYTRKAKLQIIKKPAETSRAIFSFVDTKPKLIGEGNIDYVCGTCGATLVERGWKQSLSNVVIRCPSCQSYNEFPKTHEIEFHRVKTIDFKKGEYPLTDVVWLKRGVCLIGLERN